MRIVLPLASPALLTGIRTATIVSIGTATLAALVGAGGYGVPIVSGLSLNDVPTILTGRHTRRLDGVGGACGLQPLGRFIIPAGLRQLNGLQISPKMANCRLRIGPQPQRVPAVTAREFREALDLVLA